MITEFEENETHFIFIEDLNIQYVQNDEAPLVNEFSSELIEDASLFNSAMTDLYLNPRASKYLDDYTEFDRTGLVNHAESLLRDKMRGEQNDN